MKRRRFKLRKFLAAVAVAVVAFVELCLTGQAATAWRLAEKKTLPLQLSRTSSWMGLREGGREALSGSVIEGSSHGN
jgi:hypothetical protein